MYDFYLADDLGNLMKATWNRKDSKFAEPEIVHKASSPIQRMTLLQSLDGTSQRLEIATTGRIEVLELESHNVLAHHDTESEEPICALQETFGDLMWCTIGGSLRFAQIDLADTPKELYRYQLPSPISSLRCHPRLPGVIAFGGKDRELTVWQTSTAPSPDSTPPRPHKYLGTMSQHWQAQNVENDKFDRAQPRWISDLQFIDNEAPRDRNDGFKIAAITRFGQVRVYDTNVSRQPIINVEVGEHPLVALSLGVVPQTIIISDSHSNVILYDIKKPIVLGKYKGPTGSVVSLAVARSQRQDAKKGGLLACAGLDRFLRLYDASSRQELARVYCKSKIMQVCMTDGGDGTLGEDGDEQDELWADMQTLEEDDSGDKRKRRKVRQSNS